MWKASTLRATLGVLLWASLIVVVGCTHVVTQTTPYYEDGPYQIAGPQGDLPEGTRVWVVGKEGSYARVWTRDGIDAYVWDNALMSIWEWNRKQSAERKRAQKEAKAETDEP